MSTGRQLDDFQLPDDPGVDLRRLRYFIAVCDHGGISKAASAIGIAQPALTRQIKLLEKEIGLPLITRSGRGAEPSEQGRFVLDRSRGHLEGLDRIVRDARRLFSTARGHVTLGICPTIAPFFLDDLQRFVRGHHPSVDLSVIEAYSGDLQNLMERGRLDLALTYRPTETRGLAVIELFSEKLVLIAGAGERGWGGAASLSDLARGRLILPSRIHALRRIIDRACEARGVALSPDIELDSLDAVMALLGEDGSPYLTVLPRFSVQRAVDEGELSGREFDDPAMQRTIVVMTRAAARSTALVETVVRQACARAQAIRAHFDTVF